MNILKKTLSVIAAAMLMVGAAGTITAHANPIVPPYLPVTSISEVQGTVPDLKIAKNYGTVYTISNDWGGNVLEFIEKYTAWRQSGAKVRVEGFCVSACTLMTGLLEDKNICVSPFSVFAFHSAGFGPLYQYSEAGTKLIWTVYPERVKKLLADNGWNHPSEHPDLLYIRGTDLYKECKD